MPRSNLVPCPNCSKPANYSEYMIRSYAKSSERVQESALSKAKYKTKFIAIGYFCLKCGLFKSTYVVSNEDPNSIQHKKLRDKNSRIQQ